MGRRLLRGPGLPGGPGPTSRSGHPRRDAALVHAGLASLIVLFSWLTGGDLAKAGLAALAYFAAATAWAWWRLGRRARVAAEVDDES